MNPNDPDHAFQDRIRTLELETEACRREVQRLKKFEVNPLTPNRDIALLHPAVRPQFERLQGLCQKSKHTSFRLFEGYRSPQRQGALYRQTPRVTNAKPWESLHQYGLAADFVWQNSEGHWSWHDAHPWGVLAEFAEMVGLVVPIKWDRPHVEAPWGRDLTMWIRNRK